MTGVAAGSSGRWSSQRGAAAVEMAIVFPLLLLLIGGIFDLGRYMFTKEMLTNAAREGARMVAVGYTQADADARITTSLAGGVQIAAPTYAPSSLCPATPSPTDSVTVTVSTPASGSGQFKFIILGPASRFFGATALSAPVLSGSANMRCGG